jgi:hypothetical protein
VAPAAHQSGPTRSLLKQGPPRSRAHAPLERGPSRSRAHAPSSRFPPRSRVPASLERAPPRSRFPHGHTCSRTRVRAFNALTQQSGATTCLGITPRRCSANSLGGAHPRHWPRPRRGAGRTLEPSSHDSAGSNRDVRPAGAPSPSLSILCGHPRPCCVTPCTATTTPTLLGMQGRDAATPATHLVWNVVNGSFEPA